MNAKRLFCFLENLCASSSFDTRGSRCLSWFTLAETARIHHTHGRPGRLPRAIEGGSAMPTYVMLLSFTDQGIRNIKDSPKRADAFKNTAKKAGATVKEVFWTLGQYDVVTIVEAPDDVTMTALGLATGKLGNVRTQTLRAFSAADMKNILGKMS
jgi:uncharacterized protein with GYD domain